MKLAIIGSRDFNDYDFLCKSLEPIKNHITLVVSGGAKDADSLGERWANENGTPTLIFKPDWKKYGKSAGYIRNIDIIKNCDAVVAYQVNNSVGTQHSLNIAKKQSKIIKVFKFTD